MLPSLQPPRSPTNSVSGGCGEAMQKKIAGRPRNETYTPLDGVYPQRQPNLEASWGLRKLQHHPMTARYSNCLGRILQATLSSQAVVFRNVALADVSSQKACVYVHTRCRPRTRASAIPDLRFPVPVSPPSRQWIRSRRSWRCIPLPAPRRGSGRGGWNAETT